MNNLHRRALLIYLIRLDLTEWAAHIPPTAETLAKRALAWLNGGPKRQAFRASKRVCRVCVCVKQVMQSRVSVSQLNVFCHLTMFTLYRLIIWQSLHLFHNASRSLWNNVRLWWNGIDPADAIFIVLIYGDTHINIRKTCRSKYSYFS